MSPGRGGSKASSAASFKFRMKPVRPVVPAGEAEKELEADLTLMGLSYLRELPWTLKSEEMLRECIGAPVPDTLEGTKRGKPDQWTIRDVAKAFKAPSDGIQTLSRTTNRLGGYFAGTIDAKEGWSLDQCIDDRMRQLFAYLVPILHPEKPKRITVQLGSTIVAGLIDNLRVNWAAIILERISRQATNMKGKKSTALSTYLFLLYQAEDLLTREEKVQYRTEQRLTRLNIVKLEPGVESSSDEDSDEETRVLSPQPRLVATPKRKRDEWERSGSGNESEPESGSRRTPGQTRVKVTLTRKAAECRSRIDGELANVWKDYAAMESTLNSIRKVTGFKGGDLVRTVSELADGGKMKKENGVLKANIAIEQNKLKKAEKEKLELMKLYEKVNEKAQQKERLCNLLKDYLQTVGMICTTGGKDLMGDYLYKRYFETCTGIPEAEQVVRIAEEYCAQVEDMLSDAVSATDMLKDFRAELQKFTPGEAEDYREPEPGEPDYRSDWDYRVENPDKQDEEPDTRMEETPDNRLEETPEGKPEEKMEEKEEEKPEEEEKEEEGDPGRPMTKEDWRRILRSGPQDTSMKELRDLLAEEVENEAKKVRPGSATETAIVPFFRVEEEKPRVTIEELEDDID